MTTRSPMPIVLALLVLGTPSGMATGQETATPRQPPKLKVSENRRFLVTDEGKPFFYLGDTAWELFHRLNREEAGRYLEDRAAKGFTVIQAVVLAELDGLHAPNAYGHLPLTDDDPEMPVEDYFKHVDWVVEKAESLGLYVGMLPTWGDKWNAGNGRKPVFDPENAGKFGAWLGRRYKHRPIIWVLGGDRNVENDGQRATIEAMAKGLKEGDGGGHLVTFHPRGGQSSATWFHDADWLDFNMNQNGHGNAFDGYAATRKTYDREPAKPVIDGEPIYEDHPIAFNAARNGHSVAMDVRRPLYWDLFSGAFGHTYGHHSVWQMFAPGRGPINGPLLPWFEAIAQPGAGQMVHARRLLESRPFLSRVPDDSVIVADPVPTAVPGAGLKRFVATRDAAGRYAMAYVPVGRRFSVRLDKVKGPRARAWWFNPRDGSASPAGEFPAEGVQAFRPPALGEELDWVLVLDSTAEPFMPPGVVGPNPNR